MSIKNPITITDALAAPAESKAKPRKAARKVKRTTKTVTRQDSPELAIAPEPESPAAAPKKAGLMSAVLLALAGLSIGASAWYLNDIDRGSAYSKDQDGIIATINAKVRAYQISRATVPARGPIQPAEAQGLMLAYGNQVRAELTRQFQHDAEAIAADIKAQRIQNEKVQSDAMAIAEKARADVAAAAERENRMRDEFQAKTAALEPGFRDQVEKIRADYQRRLDEREASHQAELAALKVKNEQDLLALRAENGTKITKALTDGQTALTNANAKVRMADAAEAKAAQYRADADKLVESARREAASYKSEAEAARNALKTQTALADEQIAQAKKISENAKTIVFAAIKDAADARLKAAESKAAKQEELTKLAESHEASVKRLAEQLQALNGQASNLMTAMKDAKTKADMTLDTTRKSADQLAAAAARVDAAGHSAVAATEVMKAQQAKVDALASTLDNFKKSAATKDDVSAAMADVSTSVKTTVSHALASSATAPAAPAPTSTKPAATKSATAKPSFDCAKLSAGDGPTLSAAFAKVKPSYKMGNVDTEGKIIWANKPDGTYEPVSMREIYSASGCG